MSSFRNDGSRKPPILGNIPLIEWRRLGEADGHEVAESICTFAQPAGITLRHVYEELRDTLLADLRAAMPVDVVLLFMHGAMVADGYDDCEGDTLARVREIVGAEAKIGIELDLHCHLTEEMRKSADVIITYKEYPHIDVAERASSFTIERARELYELSLAAAQGKVSPAIAYHDCRMVNMWRTPVEPMKSFVARMQSLEGKDGILSVSFGHGFPWGDVEEVGAKIVVIADGDQRKAEALAMELGREIWAMRERTVALHDEIDAAIDAALRADEGQGPTGARRRRRQCRRRRAFRQHRHPAAPRRSPRQRRRDRLFLGPDRRAILPGGGRGRDFNSVNIYLKAQLRPAHRRQMRRGVRRSGRSARHGAGGQRGSHASRAQRRAL